MPSQEYNLIHILRILNKWKTHILIITVATIVFSSVFSWFFLDDYYYSYVRLYPINMAYNDRSNMFSMGSSYVPYFGDKEDVNRVLTSANSVELAQILITKYDLAKHYKIDTTKASWKTKVRREFESNFKAIKTEQGAIEISIYDTDPQLAKKMIDDAIVKVDEMNRKSVNENKYIQLGLFDKLNFAQTQKVKNGADSIADLARQYHITIKVVGGAEILDGDDYNAVQRYKVLMVQQRNAVDLLNTNLAIRQQIKSAIEVNSSSLSIVEHPYVADRKEKPKRSIIVLVSTLLALVASTFGVLAVEEIKEIRAKI